MGAAATYARASWPGPLGRVLWEGLSIHKRKLSAAAAAECGQTSRWPGGHTPAACVQALPQTEGCVGWLRGGRGGRTVMSGCVAESKAWRSPACKLWLQPAEPPPDSTDCRGCTPEVQQRVPACAAGPTAGPSPPGCLQDWTPDHQNQCVQRSAARHDRPVGSCLRT